MKLLPLEDRVVILQDDATKQTNTGIFIPDTSQRKPSTGTVVWIGPGKADKGKPLGYLHNDEFHQSMEGREIKAEDRIVGVYEMPIKEGDKVFFYQHSGVPIKLEEVEYVVLRVSDVISRL